jgi:hypothetical protein
MGLIKTGQEMNEQAKVAARAALIQKGLATASGDLEKTQGGVANQWRKLTGGLENFATSMGELLMPAISEGVSMFNEWLIVTVKYFEDSKPLITSWVEYFKSGIAKVGEVVRNFGDYWELAKISATQAIANITAVFDTIPANLAIIGAWIGNTFAKTLASALESIQNIFKNAGTNIGEYLFAAIHNALTGDNIQPMFVDLLGGFKVVFDELPALAKPAFVDMSVEMDKVLDKIAAKEKARAAALGKGPAAKVAEQLGDLGGGAKDKEEKKKKGKADATAGALELGSVEAASAIAKFRNQAVDDKPAKETAAATKETAMHTKNTAQALREIAIRQGQANPGLGAFTF